MMRPGRKKTLLIGGAVSVLAIAIYAAGVLWRASRASTESARELQAASEIRFTTARLDRPPAGGFEWFSTPAVFADAVPFRDALYLCGPAGLFEYDAQGALKRRFRPGAELPPAPLGTLAEFDAKFRGRITDGSEYWLRCTLTGRASLGAVTIQNDIQMAPLAMPSMVVGDNRFTYLEHTDEKTGANASRKLRITHTWVERSKTRPPKAPESPVYPANGGESDGTDVVFQWNAVTDPDGDAITDYHFQLSDRPDMRWPMSPNFDKYISRTPDKGKTCYALPRPGLLTHGEVYYWRVKAKDSNGVWGPWSSTWSAASPRWRAAPREVPSGNCAGR